jgi:hypothetical protein
MLRRLARSCGAINFEESNTRAAGRASPQLFHSSQRKEAGRQKEHHQGPALQISKNAIIKPRINESVDFHSHGGLSGRSVVALVYSILFKEPIL